MTLCARCSGRGINLAVLVELDLRIEDFIVQGDDNVFCPAGEHDNALCLGQGHKRGLLHDLPVNISPNVIAGRSVRQRQRGGLVHQLVNLRVTEP